MSVTAIVGAQWGDEGKGKIVDFFCEKYNPDVVIRCQGGNNAGHTIIKEDGSKIVLRLLPSGVLNPKILNIIGHGVVLDPVTLLEELKNFEGIKDRLLISDKAHIIHPWHKYADQQTNIIGTTGNGIGPCYAAKALRQGLRLKDFISKDESKIIELLNFLNPEFYKTSQEDVRKIWNNYLNSLYEIIEKYSDIIQDIHPIVQRSLKENRDIVLEGAQGVMLDLDMGTYPFVTSSNTLPSGLCWGSGIPINKVDRIIGILKAYTTRVGEGPFPTEDTGEFGEKIQHLGNEFGAVTGRKRRCGHLDLVQLKYAHELCGFTELIITKFDIISSLEEMKVCIEYVSDTPKYKIFKNPSENKQEILDFIEDYLGVKISYVSIGPKREEIANKKWKFNE